MTTARPIEPLAAGRPHPAGPDRLTDQLPPCAGALTDVLHDVPYSSAAQFYEYFGSAPADARYGKSCAWQSFEVGKRLAAAGGPTVRYHVDGRHVAAVVHRDAGLIVLDPYLLHLDPLVLDRADVGADGRVTVTSPALPVRRAADGGLRPGLVRATWIPAKERLTLEYQRYSPTRDHHVVSRFFTLPTDRELVVVPPPAAVIRPLLLHPEQNNISVRVVDPTDRQMREIIHPIDPTGRTPIDATGLWARDNQGVMTPHGDRGFAQVADRIAETLRVRPVDVIDYVLGAAAIHRRVAPADLALLEYKVAAE